MIFFFIEHPAQTFIFIQTKSNRGFMNFFYNQFNLLDKNFIFLFLALENPNKQVRVGFYAKQTSDSDSTTRLVGNRLSWLFWKPADFFIRYFFSELISYGFFRSCGQIFVHVRNRQISKDFGNLRHITADFESTLTKDCASFRKIPQDCVILQEKPTAVLNHRKKKKKYLHIWYQG